MDRDDLDQLVASLIVGDVLQECPLRASSSTAQRENAGHQWSPLPFTYHHDCKERRTALHRQRLEEAIAHEELSAASGDAETNTTLALPAAETLPGAVPSATMAANGLGTANGGLFKFW